MCMNRVSPQLRPAIKNPDDMPRVHCPRCGRLHVDYDGFGVLRCEHCGFCKHPSITDDVCDLCDRRLGTEA